MNAYMNISVRVLSANAQAQIRALQAQVRALQGQLAAANATAAAPNAIGSSRSRKTLGAWGNQIQWTGRQLQYNWTVPLLLAGAAATKFALDNERALTRVTKVYGDYNDALEWSMKNQDKWVEGATSAAENVRMTFEREINALEEAFEALSSHYGVQQKEVLETAGAWAAAGASGAALAKSTELSLQAAVLGDMELAKATEALIAIQSQYSLNTSQLTKTLAELNAIENQTGISMQGLIDGFARSAGVAREAGIDVEHLGAMLAALVPATGTAATAGNALKTIISRIMSPTQDASDVMREFGVDTSDAMWQSSTAMERLMVLAGKMDDGLAKTGEATKSLADDGYRLSDSQKQVVASVLGSRYQMNRFLVLMRELGPEQSYFEKALSATSNTGQVFAQMNRELNEVLSSSPKRLEIMWYTLQNGMADAVQPLIPYLLYLAQSVASMVQWFSNLNPEVQKLFLILGVGLALVGPVVKYFGSLLTLIWALSRPIALLSAGFSFLFSLLFTKSIILNGVQVVVRRSLIGIAAAILALPFRFFAAGLGLIITSFISVTKVAWAASRSIGLIIAFQATIATSLIVVWKTAAISLIAVWKSTAAMLRILFVLSSLANISVWTKFSKAILLISAATGTALRAVWAATMSSLVLIFGRAGVAIVAFARKWLTITVILANLKLAIAVFSASIIPILTSPWTIAILAVVGILYTFRGQIGQIWNNVLTYFSDSNNAVVQGIISAWNMLPQGVANALTAVVRIVQQAAMQVYEWLSYLNPFARHSPSLVDSVSAGMGKVRSEFNSLKSVKGVLSSVRGDIQSFNKTASAVSGPVSLETTPTKKVSPDNGGDVENHKRRLAGLNAVLATLESRVDAQQTVVDRWTDKLEAANKALDRQQDKLERLTDIQSFWQEKLDEAQSRLQDYASAPIKGMGEMEDKIFANEMAQKRLRMEIMKMEDAGGSLDSIKSKLDAIAGAQEMIQGEREGLRGAGAGSEILGQYDEQISKLDEQKKALEDQAKPIQDLTSRLEELQRNAERLDLEKSLKFDVLARQIEKAANATKELSFEEIMEGVRKAQEDIGKYGDKVDEATKAVERQQKAVDAATRVRDALQNRLDRENEILDKLKDKYDKVQEAVSNVKSALDKATGSASDLSSKMDGIGKGKGASGEGYVSPAVQNFRDAAGGNFAQVGGAGIPLRTDWKDQSEKIKEFTKNLSDQTAGVFADLNPFTPIKEKWGEFKAWWSEKWASVKSIAKDFASSALDGVSFGGGSLDEMWDKVRVAWASVYDFINNNVVQPLVSIWNLFWPDLKKIAEEGWRGLKSIWDNVAPEIAKFADLIAPAWEAIKNLWFVAKIYIGYIVLRFLFFAKIVTSIIANVIKPVLDTLGNIFENVIQVIRGVFQVVIGIFTIFTGDFHTLFAGLGNILSGLGGIIGQALWGLAKIALSLIKGLVAGIFGYFVWLGDKITGGAISKIVDWIVGAFEWLYDKLIGHSIIMIEGIWGAFKALIKLGKWIFSIVIKPVIWAFTTAWNIVKGLLKLWWAGIQLQWAVLKGLGTWLWDNVLTPIWNVVKSLWNNFVKPAFGLWWSGIKLQWNILRTLASWLWNYVLKPIVSIVVALWKNFIAPAFKFWWTGIKNVWSILKKIPGWLWDNVLKPTWDRIKSLWKNFVQPFLKAWWGWIKLVWNALKQMGKWLWDNVLKPSWERFKDLWERVVTSLRRWWDGIKTAWNVLKQLGRWVWDNVLRPVWDKTKDLWERVVTSLRRWWDGIKAAWNSLKQAGKWIKDNVMDPVFNAIKNGWTSIKNWLSNNKDMLLGPVRGIVNVIISAVNKLISGLNKISDILPGSINWNISPIPQFAQGGLPPKRSASRGFKTSGARAIVGEGKSNYPEFVIPTDPTFRKRAQTLLLAAASKIGAGVSFQGVAGDTPKDIRRVIASNPSAARGAIPEYGMGGWLSGAIGDAINWAEDALRDAVGMAINPVLDFTSGMIRKAGWAPAQIPADYMISKVRDWVNDTENQYQSEYDQAQDALTGGPKVRAALAWARTQAGKPYGWGGVGPGAYDCSGFQSALVNHLRGKPLHSRVGSTATFPWGGFSGGVGEPKGYIIGSTKSYAGGVGHMAGTLGGVNVEASSGAGVRVGGGARGYGDSGFSTVAHLALKEGAIALANRGPALATIGDGRYDEAVVPLPKGWRSGVLQGNKESSKTYIFNGDLSFPNITSGEDAKTFIDNLESLAKE